MKEYLILKILFWAVGIIGTAALTYAYCVGWFGK